MSVKGGPNIVSSGLILHLDASNTDSYPGTGTKWYDLSGFAKTGTLGSPTFNNGVFDFDGDNDVVNFGAGDPVIFPLPLFSIEIWLKSLGTKPTTATLPGLFGITYGLRCDFDETGRVMFVTNNGTQGQFTQLRDPNKNYFDNTWHQCVFMNDSTKSYIYSDSNFSVSGNATWIGTTYWSGNTFNIGRDNNNSSQFFYGSIGNIKIYNRILNPTEIVQSYNAIRGRYGI